MTSLKAGVDRDQDEMAEELVEMVRSDLGAVACFRECAFVNALPKTRSGKILRGTLRKMADGENYSIPSTIEDVSVLDGITKAARKMGYEK